MQKIILGLLAVVLAGWIACERSTLSSRPVKYVAYVGFNYSDTTKARKNNYSDSLHIIAVEDYLKHINAVTEPRPYPVEYRLVSFQCDYREDTIQQIYNAIAADTNIALVIDNTWGRHISHAKDIVRDRIPVISLSADYNSLDFGNNAIFLEPNDPQPFYLIQFIRSVLKAPSVGLITEKDYLLHNEFEKVIRRYGLPCDTLLSEFRQADLRNNLVPKADSARVVRRLRNILAATREKVILVNLHSAYGNFVIRALQQAPKGEISPKTIIGIQNFTNLNEQELEDLTSEKQHTIIRYESTEDALPEEVYKHKEDIEERFPKKFFRTKGADNNLRRCFDAMNIFEIALLAGNSTRREFVQYFKKLTDRKITILNELYEFDSTLILKKEPTFNRVHGGKTRSFPTQINTSGNPIPNLRVGIDVIDINDIDVRKNTFDCNLLYWVIADSQYIQKEGYVDFSNISSEEANRYLIAEERDSNYVVRIYRISGKFLGKFKSFNFPFDRHELRIPITALSSSDKIKISFDYSRLQINDKIEEFQLNDWDTEKYFVTLDNQLNNALGSLDKVTFDSTDKAKYLEKYKNLNVHLKVNREPWGAIILIIMPFLMFSALPIFMLFFHKASFEEVGELIITSFLATVAYSINLVQISPATDSMNLAYVFLMLTLGVNFFCFIYVTYIDRQKTGREETVVVAGEKGRRKLFRINGRIWVPYLLALLLFMLLYLLFGK